MATAGVDDSRVGPADIAGFGELHLHITNKIQVKSSITYTTCTTLNIHKFKGSNAQMQYKCSNTQFKCSNAHTSMHIFANAKMHKCTNAQMQL